VSLQILTKYKHWDSYLSGWIAERTNIITAISKLSGRNGGCQSSAVISHTNAWHLKQMKIH